MKIFLLDIVQIIHLGHKTSQDMENERFRLQDLKRCKKSHVMLAMHSRQYFVSILLMKNPATVASLKLMLFSV